MKKFAIIFIVFIAGCAMMNQIADKDKYFEFIEEHDLSQKDAFNATLEWMAQNYGSSKEVIQMQNEETGKIIGKGIGTYTFNWVSTMNFNYTLTVTARDNKTKFEFQTLDGDHVIEKTHVSQLNEYYQGIVDRIMEYYSESKSDDF